MVHGIVLPPHDIWIFRKINGWCGPSVHDALLYPFHHTFYVHFTEMSPNFRDHLWKSQYLHFWSKRWPLGAVYTTLLGWSIINSFVCHKENMPKFTNAQAKPLLLQQLLQFCNAQINLPRELHPDPIVQLECSTTIVPQRSFITVMKNRLNLSLGHFPRWHPQQRQCKMHKIRRTTHFFCSYCGVFLHCKFCFELFHTAENVETASSWLWYCSEFPNNCTW